MEQRGGKEDVKGEGEAVQGAGRVLGTVLEVSFLGGGKVLGIWAVRMVGRGERKCSHACAPRTSIKYEVMYWGFK